MTDTLSCWLELLPADIASAAAAWLAAVMARWRRLACWFAELAGTPPPVEGFCKGPAAVVELLPSNAPYCNKGRRVGASKGARRSTGMPAWWPSSVRTQTRMLVSSCEWHQGTSLAQASRTCPNGTAAASLMTRRSFNSGSICALYTAPTTLFCVCTSREAWPKSRSRPRTRESKSWLTSCATALGTTNKGAVWGGPAENTATPASTAALPTTPATRKVCTPGAETVLLTSKRFRDPSFKSTLMVWGTSVLRQMLIEFGTPDTRQGGHM
mmetsp:Transcript_27813/g.60990  ORF Transcript_27813/g.60990 Transcript_27813/m.60990 type:complete len:269 (-) Transcript_27813:111-917(-)